MPSAEAATGHRNRRFTVGNVVVAVGAGALALAALSNAMGNTLAQARPGLAALQLGADPNIRLKAAIAANPNGDMRPIQGMARTALAGRALNPLALSVLGLAIEQNGGKADRYMAVSDRFSRRVSWSQLWMLEHSVSKDDIPGALNRYDILLSLSSDYWGLLFPTLDEALDSPEIAREFASHLRSRRTWTSGYFSYMVGHSPKPERLGRVVLFSGGVSHARSMGLDTGRLFGQLADTGQVNLLRTLFLSDPSADRALLTTPSTTGAAFEPSLAPIAWELPSSSAAVYPERRGEGHALRIVADPESSARALRKFLFLSPGRYRLDYGIEAARAGEESSAAWNAACVGAETQQTAPVDISRPGRGQFIFSIPAGCRAVSLTLQVAGGSNQDGSEFTLGDFQLKPIAD